jgi:hypothetical protein
MNFQAGASGRREGDRGAKKSGVRLVGAPVTFMAGSRTFTNCVAKTPLALDAAAARTSHRMAGEAVACRTRDTNFEG